MKKAEIIDNKKSCTRCGEFKDFSEFSKSSTGLNGLNAWCKVCFNEYAVNKTRENGSKPKRLAVIDNNGNKLCLGCNVVKPLTEFVKHKLGLGGYHNRCKQCSNEYSAAYNAIPENSERNKTYHLNLRSEDPSIITDIRVRKHEISTNTIVTRDGTVDKGLIVNLKSSEQCYYCGDFINADQKTIDHKTPLSRGGVHSKDNIVLACRSCNCKKQALTETEFRDKYNYKYAY